MTNFLFLLLVASPVLLVILLIRIFHGRAKRWHLGVFALALAAVYALYESTIPPGTNIRVDLLIIVPIFVFAAMLTVFALIRARR